jgi:hypothetical protein
MEERIIDQIVIALSKLKGTEEYIKALQSIRGSSVNRYTLTQIEGIVEVSGAGSFLWSAVNGWKRAHSDEVMLKLLLRYNSSSLQEKPRVQSFFRR